MREQLGTLAGPVLIRTPLVRITPHRTTHGLSRMLISAHASITRTILLSGILESTQLSADLDILNVFLPLVDSRVK